ncbi:hypothetical protein CHUAL_006481 [Chamberlinius hualienensis]
MATWMNDFFLAILIFLLLMLQVAAEARFDMTNLTVALYRVYGTRVEIDWYMPHDALTSCELIYGPMDRPDLVQVLPNVILNRQMLELVDLSSNISYHFHMICYGSQQAKYVSNTLVFTTDTNIRPDRMMISSSSSQRENLNIMSNGMRSFPVALESNQRIPSSNVILGATCGIVGFLIINITVVMVVRKYSYTRMRRRRMFALQYENDPSMERAEYEGFPDI